MQILHIIDTYTDEVRESIALVDQALDLLPVSVHRLTIPWGSVAEGMLASMNTNFPLVVPAVLLIKENHSVYLYPSSYEEEDMVGAIVNFFQED